MTATHFSTTMSSRNGDVPATSKTECGRRSRNWVGRLEHQHVTCPDCIERMRISDNYAEDDGRKRTYGTTR